MREDQRAAARIMVVDDEPQNVRYVTDVLQWAGYETVEGLTDPTEAVNRFDDFDPDLVILDLLMPGMNGFEVMDAMRESVPEDVYLPFLILTSDITSESRRRALSGGARDFLTKPMSPTEVRLRVDNLLHREGHDGLAGVWVGDGDRLGRVDCQSRGLVWRLVDRHGFGRDDRLAGREVDNVDRDDSLFLYRVEGEAVVLDDAARVVDQHGDGHAVHLDDDLQDLVHLDPAGLEVHPAELRLAAIDEAAGHAQLALFKAQRFRISLSPLTPVAGASHRHQSHHHPNR